MRVTHRLNNINADRVSQAPTLDSQPVSVSFKIENTGEIELYRVKTYHDPVSPVNSGWAKQCDIGALKPGQIRYCKRDITLSESGLNQAMGRVQGVNAITSATDVVNASNPTYFKILKRYYGCTFAKHACRFKTARKSCKVKMIPNRLSVKYSYSD